MASRRSGKALILLVIGALSTCTTAPVPTGLTSGPPGPPAKLGFLVQPSVAAAGQLLSPAIEVAVQDTEGHTVPTVADTITLAIGANPSNATLSGTTTMPTVNGVATFSTLTLTTAGTGYTLNAYAVGLRGTTSAAFNVTAGSPAQLGFLVQPPVGGAADVLGPAVQVAIQDAQGATVTSATNSVTLAIGWNPARGRLSGPMAVAAINGVATFSGLSIDSAGPYTLVASAGGLTPATSDTFLIVPSSFASISTGGGAACALTTAGVAYCWGDNSYGELGVGTFVGPESCHVDYCSTVPVAVLGGLTFRGVSVGFDHTCGVTASGAAYCWGLNGYGALGDGATTEESVPVAVEGGLTFTGVSVGEEYSCGVTTTGAGYCWGRNDSGLLGNGTTTSSAEPVAISGGLTFTAISTGDVHACGIVSSGAAYCWGDNSAGELGNGTTTSSNTPVPVSGGLAYTVVSAGLRSSCGLTPDGTIYCWGDNTNGQLGNGTTISSTSPVALSSSLKFATASVGVGFACGVTTGGAAACWGGLAVSTSLTFSALSAGGSPCALTTTGAAYCWGNNQEGQFGNGTTSSNGTTVPVPVFDRARASAGGRLRAAAR